MGASLLALAKSIYYSNQTSIKSLLSKYQYGLRKTISTQLEDKKIIIILVGIYRLPEKLTGYCRLLLEEELCHT